MKGIFLILLHFSFFNSSGSDINLLKKAEDLFGDENFKSALPLFVNLLQNDPDNTLLSFKAGICCLHTGNNFEQALYYFQKASQNPSIGSKVYFFIGNAYLLSGKTDDALVNFKKYLNMATENDEYYSLSKRNVELCINAIELMKSPVNAILTNAGKNINSDCDDFSPILTPDKTVLLFSSRREGSIGGNYDYNSQLFSDVYQCNKTNSNWSMPINIGKYINTELNDHATGISHDGQTLFLYKEKYESSSGNIFVSHIESGIWTASEKFGSNSITTDLNSNYTEQNACISPDQQTIFFSSDRPGGYGGFDLYKVQKLPTGEWGLALNLGETLNTVYDENYPFIHSDGISFYFASQGHNSMGGYDLFKTSVLSSYLWEIPTNLGYPLNSTCDDISYFKNPGINLFYFASSRPDGLGGFDIYEAEIPNNYPITLMSGYINIEDTSALKHTEIIVLEKENNLIEGMYHPNNRNGKFILTFIPGKSYILKVNSPGYECYTEHITISQNINIFELEKIINLKCQQNQIVNE